MNIFTTNDCPIVCAREHTNVHVVKMILESAQMLSTAHHVLDGTTVGYKPTHMNHPSSKWIRETRDNYVWALNLFEALCAEYTFRAGKVHKTSGLACNLARIPKNIPQGSLTTFAMAMPDEFKMKGLYDPTKGYQAYLNFKFSGWKARPRPMKVEWTNRTAPSWYVPL